MRISFIVILLFVLTGCKTSQPVIERTVTWTETLRDTVVIVEPDFASVRALFECDSLNRVVMKELEIKRGQKVTPEVKWQYGVLEVSIPVDSQAVYLSWKERHGLTQETITITEISKVKEKPPWWMRGLSSLGGFALFLSIIFLFLKLKLR